MTRAEGFAGYAGAAASGLRVAVLVPCFNEEAAIGKVVNGFRTALPHATIYVYDNNSTDRTTEVARAAGAFVRRETHQGKGFVKSFPVLSRGFEIETELAVHALELELPVAEVPTPYYARPQGSASKLSTGRDGLRILAAIVRLSRSERPLAFFSAIGIALAALSVAIAIPIFITFIETGLVPRFPTAILSTGLMLLAFLSIACGLILDTVTRGRREIKLLAYLQQPAPGERSTEP